MADNIDCDMVTNHVVLPIPSTQVPPSLVMNQNEQDDNNGDSDERELPLFLLKKMPDRAFMQVISNLPLRRGGTFIANYACRRLNRILGTTVRLVPVAYNHPSLSHIALYIIALSDYLDFHVPWAYDPISNGWYKFPLNRSVSRRNWNWEKIASAGGLVCAPSCPNFGDMSATYELEIFDPYTQRFRTLPPGPMRGALGLGENILRGYRANFSTNIWIIDPATCEYKVIVMRCMYNIARASNYLFVQSYDRTRNWKVLQLSSKALPPGWEMVGNSIICHDTLYSMFQNTSLDDAVSQTVGQQLFLRLFWLKSTKTRFIQKIYPLPGPLCLPAVILNCNNNLILVGANGTESGGMTVEVWRFNPDLPAWRKLGVMPHRFLHMLSKSLDFHSINRCTGGGNFVYFRNRNSYENNLVVLDLSMTDESGLRLREEAWKEASECPIHHNPDGSLNLWDDFCYEPRLLMGVPL